MVTLICKSGVFHVNPTLLLNVAAHFTDHFRKVLSRANLRSFGESRNRQYDSVSTQFSQPPLQKPPFRLLLRETQGSFIGDSRLRNSP